MSCGGVLRSTPVVAAIIAVACAVPKPPAPVAPAEPVQINAAFGTTWNAVVDFLADNRIIVRTIDRASGLIVAEPVRYVYKRGEPLPADCGSNLYGAVSPTAGTYSIIVRGDEVRSTVRADVRFRYVDPDPEDARESFDCSSMGIWERRLIDSVRDRASRRPEPNRDPLHSGVTGR